MDIKNVIEMVQNYFKDGTALKNYEVIGVIPNNSSAFSEDNYLYRVLAKYVGENEYKTNTYAVWTSFNTSSNSMNYGHYDMSYKKAYELFSKGVIEPDVGVSTERLVELGKTLAEEIDGMIADPEDSYKLFKRLGLTEEELELFGIKKPKRYKKVNVEVTLKFPVVMEMDDDENYISDIEDYASDFIDNNGIDYYYCDADVIREDMTAVEAKNTCEDCFGYDDIEV